MHEQLNVTEDQHLSNAEATSSNMAATQKPFKVLATGLTDIGLVRQNNEDVWSSEPQVGLYVIADGMGGHQAGEIAARETVKALCKAVKLKIPTLEANTISDVSSFLKRAVIHVNGVVYKLGRTKPELRGMGTTLCCLLFHSKGLAFAHVGDSRIYRLRGNKFEQLTKDHSLFRELVDKGQLNEEQITDFLYKNIITKAMGTEPKIEPTVATKRVNDGDIYLMCTDGLSDLLASEEMSKIITSALTIEEAAQNLIAAANDKGGRDNVTVVIAKVESVR